MDIVQQCDLERYGLKKLEAEAFELFQSYLSQMESGYASTMSFASMIAWRQVIPIYYKEAEGFLQVVANDTCQKRTGWLPLIGNYGNGRVRNALAWQVEMTRQFGIQYQVTDVSRQMLPYYRETLPIVFDTKSDDGDSDYIYTLEDFNRALDKPKERYNYKYFIRNFEPIVEVLEPHHLEQCQEFISQSWCCWHFCGECGYGCQKDTAASILSDIAQSGANGIAVFSKGQMIGYCIVSQENGQIIFLFKKTRHGVRGINEFLHKECVARFAGNADKVNYTEDMNIKGLRQYKQRLCQYELYPKYTLKEKQIRGELS